MTDRSPESTQLFEKGRLARQNGEYDTAIDLFKRIIAVAPDHALAHSELGLVYCFTGSFDESVEELVLAAKLAPKNLDIRLYLAKTYTMLGEYEKGAAVFSEIMTLSSPGEQTYDEAAKQLYYLHQCS